VLIGDWGLLQNRTVATAIADDDVLVELLVLSGNDFGIGCTGNPDSRERAIQAGELTSI
jgi:hypothetical protein